MKVVVMGVSGCGKSTVGAALARSIGAKFIDGDNLHPESNKKKMASGIPLNDVDRSPWLENVGRTLDSEKNIIVACSALKKSYREKILEFAPSVQFVHLHGSKELLLGRLEARTDHFMPASLLDSQLATLENLDKDEPGHEFDISSGVPQLIGQISTWLTQSSK